MEDPGLVKRKRAPSSNNSKVIKEEADDHDYLSKEMSKRILETVSIVV
jgi:hypothetical protein